MHATIASVVVVFAIADDRHLGMFCVRSVSDTTDVRMIAWYSLEDRRGYPIYGTAITALGS